MSQGINDTRTGSRGDRPAHVGALGDRSREDLVEFVDRQPVAVGELLPDFGHLSVTRVHTLRLVERPTLTIRR